AGPALLVREPDVDLGGRLGEREEVRAEPGATLRAALRARERIERAAQVRHRQALVHRQPLYLMEDRGVSRIQLVGAEGAADGYGLFGKGALAQGAAPLR